MAHYMHQWTYKDGQIKKMITEPQDRAEIVRVATAAFGGTLHAFYFTFGEYDGVSITEFPDDATAMACLLSVVGQGAIERVRTTVLLTPEEGQRAMATAYGVVGRRPGGD